MRGRCGGEAEARGDSEAVSMRASCRRRVEAVKGAGARGLQYGCRVGAPGRAAGTLEGQPFWP